jgi:uncharacterized protein (DUF2236 family)
MMVGGMAALLLQMLHPAVLAGVWDHSNFREDMRGRLRRTARFIALTTYGSREDAEAAIARVRQIHEHVRGTSPDGRIYSAADPDLLTWVHATETICFLDAWVHYGQPAMRLAEQDRYFSEMAVVALGLGAASVPVTRAATLRYLSDMRPQLRADRRSHEVAGLILEQSAPGLERVPLGLMQQAAVDLLPDWARRMHGLPAPGLSRPLVAAGTFALAQTLRWAFR